MQMQKVKKRKQVKRACINCAKSKTACSTQRPCTRCIAHEIADTCIDAPRKKRQAQQSFETKPAWSGLLSKLQASHPSLRKFKLEENRNAPKFNPVDGLQSSVVVAQPIQNNLETPSNSNNSAYLVNNQNQNEELQLQQGAVNLHPQSTVSIPSPYSSPVSTSSEIDESDECSGNEEGDYTTPGEFLEHFMDATTLAQIQQQLAQCTQLEAKWAYFTAIAPKICVSLWRLHNIILLDHNYEFSNLFGKKGSNLRGITCRDMYKPTHASKCSSIIQLLMSDRISICYLKQLWCVKGKEIPVSTVMKTEFENGKAVRILLLTVPLHTVKESDCFFVPEQVKLIEDCDTLCGVPTGQLHNQEASVRSTFNTNTFEESTNFSPLPNDTLIASDTNVSSAPAPTSNSYSNNYTTIVANSNNDNTNKQNLYQPFPLFLPEISSNTQDGNFDDFAKLLESC